MQHDYALIRIHDNHARELGADIDLTLIKKLCSDKVLTQGKTTTFLRVPLTKFNRQKITKEELFKRIPHLHDIGVRKLIVYYAGHSLNSEQGHPFPFLQMGLDKECTTERIEQNEFEALFNDIGFSMVVMVYDSCNVRISSVALARHKHVGENIEALDDIWLNSGQLYICSTIINEEASGSQDVGGNFTTQFIPNLVSNKGNWIASANQTIVPNQTTQTFQVNFQSIP